MIGRRRNFDKFERLVGRLNCWKHADHPAAAFVGSGRRQPKDEVVPHVMLVDLSAHNFTGEADLGRIGRGSGG